MKTWGETLRSERESHGRSLAWLAGQITFSKSYIGMVEQNERPPTYEFAERCDRALGTFPLLVFRYWDQLGKLEDNDMDRRALVRLAGCVAGTGLLPGLAEYVRKGLWEVFTPNTDMEEVVAHYARQFVIDASPAYGASLLAQTNVALERIKDKPTPDLLRHTARLAELQGLYLGNQLDYAGAANWYATAAMLADRSGDKGLYQYTLARTANRTLFEGASPRSVLNGVQHALSFDTGLTPGKVEACAATVCISAITGDHKAGQKALAEMTEGAYALADGDVANLPERAILHRAYLDARLAPEAQAYATCDRAIEALHGLPYWGVEAGLYKARRMVLEGDVAGGLAYAVEAVQNGPEVTGVVGVAIRDLLQAVPPSHRKSEEMAALFPLASRRPGPWETFAKGAS